MMIVELLGHLGNDPETRFTPSGQKVTNFSVATNTRRGGQDVTHWCRVTVWGDNNIVQYLKKGSAVIVVGEISRVDTYVDKSGQTQVSIDVTAEMLRFPPFGRDRAGQGQQQSNDGFQQQPQQPTAQPAEQSPADTFQNSSVDEEPIPF